MATLPSPTEDQPRPGSRTGTAWEKAASTFIIFLPQSSPPYEASQTCLSSDLDQLFHPASNEIPKLGVAEETQNIVAERSSGDVVSLGRFKSAPSPPAKSLPSLNALQRPDVLFPQQAPYHMTVKLGRTTITVQGSHQPSLELLANYLKKWINTRMVDFRKVIDPTAFPGLLVSFFHEFTFSL